MEHAGLSDGPVPAGHRVLHRRRPVSGLDPADGGAAALYDFSGSDRFDCDHDFGRGAAGFVIRVRVFPDMGARDQRARVAFETAGDGAAVKQGPGKTLVPGLAGKSHNPEKFTRPRRFWLLASGSWLLLFSLSEPVAHDRFHQQVIRALRDADAHSEVELPSRREIQVDRRHDLLLLLAQQIETADRAQRTVVFETTGDLLRDIVAHLEI